VNPRVLSRTLKREVEDEMLEGNGEARNTGPAASDRGSSMFAQYDDQLDAEDNGTD